MLSWTVVCLLLSVMGCGPNEPIIEMPAADMNFSAADLGPGWSLDAEQGLDELMEEAPTHVLDASMRAFTSVELMGSIVSMLFRTKSVASAQREMNGAFVEEIQAGLQGMAADSAFEEKASPSIGDEAMTIGGKATLSGIEVNGYVLTFRRANVIAMVFLLAPGEFATEENVATYARRLEAKISGDALEPMDAPAATDAPAPTSTPAPTNTLAPKSTTAPAATTPPVESEPSAEEEEKGEREYDTVFPLPEDVQNVTGEGGDGRVNFQTSLAMDEVIAFYRDAFTDMGLSEYELLTTVQDEGFSMVFTGWPSGEELVIQGVVFGESTNVNIRLEEVVDS
jgi:hypothetical protein